MSIAEYYDNQADEYLEKVSKGFMRIIRQKEKTSVLEDLKPDRDDIILDVGAGCGFYAVDIKEKYNSKILCVDISPKMVERLKARGIDAIVGDIEKLELGNLTFNKIICLGVLEFCKHPSLALGNIIKYLERDGFILILVTSYSIFGVALFFYHLIKGVKMNLFSKRKIKKFLHENNLYIESITSPFPISCLIKARRQNG